MGHVPEAGDSHCPLAPVDVRRRARAVGGAMALEDDHPGRDRRGPAADVYDARHPLGFPSRDGSITRVSPGTTLLQGATRDCAGLPSERLRISPSRGNSGGPSGLFR